ncbi:MarR family winged helix-turn-helix transcriptional regulator [Amycolatopsis acidicola]|uniref:MarR family winged helix-turn-helix transcriptional regulator n=1 Tax=Amycolatopsis acidicola TaxID=2596893 RepID=UPI001409A9B7|nr:MarR family winged helix-turn-helix transcriptional regulator [Amycolatopsis acidicola]
MTDTADLAQSLREVFGRAQRALREQSGRFGLTPSQAEALGYVLRDGPLTITALAKRQSVRSQSMGATVGVLLEQELVTVTPDPSDGRQKVVTVTEKARALVAKGRNARTDWFAKQLDTLSPGELRTLAEAQKLLGRIFP